MSFVALLEILNIVAATAEAAVRARQTYNKLKEAALQNKELTPEQAAQLDARAEAIFASAASQPSGR